MPANTVAVIKIADGIEPVNPHIHDDGSGGCNCCGVPANLCDCREDCD
jgi:hypothetical protein